MGMGMEEEKRQDEAEAEGDGMEMHIYNAWLPQSIKDKILGERQQFSKLVARLNLQWQPDNGDPETRLKTVGAIPLIMTFIRAKSDIAVLDLESLTRTALKLILCSCDNLYIQQQWAHCSVRILRKYRRKLKLTIEWFPLYELLMNVHFERRHSYEGYASKSRHLDALIALIQKCRRFFPKGSAVEIWNEFRPFLNDVSHNSALEGVGFLSLFLPTPLEKTEDVTAFYTSGWMLECLTLWDAVPHSNYWSLQWASLLGRCIKHRANTSLDCEPFLRVLYMQYLRSFEVPVGKSGAWPPIFRGIPREVRNAFYGYRNSTPISVVVARSIVYLLTPGGAGHKHLETLIDLLEQYYHPSNGGSWTSSLERFLRHLVFYFMKRIANEQAITRAESGGTGTTGDENPHFLGPDEREAFVKVVMRLIERGQYSKNSSLAACAVTSAARLSYLEPTIVLPYVVSCFQSAMDTITATHQLQSSLTGLGLTVRTLLLASAKEDSEMSLRKMDTGLDHANSLVEVTLSDCRSILVDAMFNTLLGLDANDPPKTLATLQLYSSVLSSVTMVESLPAGQSSVFPIDWSLWVEMFLSRLFVLLLNLEPPQPSLEADPDSEADNGFLMNSGSHYSALLSLLFVKATPSLYDQALNMVTKFVRGNILPGAVDEIGMLCSLAVSVNPSKAFPQLVKPIMNSIILSLVDTPSTGFSAGAAAKSSYDFKVGLSPALERTVTYQVKVLSKAAVVGGSALPLYKELLKNVIAAAFDAPSLKVNEAGNLLLRWVIWSMVYYYPLTVSGPIAATIEHADLEKWFSSKWTTPPEETAPKWHEPDDGEISFVEELLQLHLRNSLADLRTISETKSSGQELRELLRVILLRLDGSLQGLGSCLPDFNMPLSGATSQGGIGFEDISIAGAAGKTVGSAALREEIAETLHTTCEYMLRDRADDTMLLNLLSGLMDFVGNFGGVDYIYWQQRRADWNAEAKSLTEPHANLITCPDARRVRRPWWMIEERASLHKEYRASQAGYHRYHGRPDAPAPVILLLKDLLKLSLHSYYAVRKSAGSKVSKILRRYPALVKECIPVLTESLQDAQAKEETVLGACSVLTYTPVMRYLMQDWSALASFFLSLLRSSHHETIKAQNAINELFLVFNLLYGGVPASSYANAGGAASLKDHQMSYSMMIAHIQGQVMPGGPVTVHWRYHLMANGILLFLVLPPPSNVHSLYAGTVAKSRENMAGGFVANLQSELPALRPLSVVALLFLLQASSSRGQDGRRMIRHSPRSSWRLQYQQQKQKQEKQQLQEVGNKEDDEEATVMSLKSTIVSIMQSNGFGRKVISNLAVDHHYFEGQNSYNPQRMSDVGLMALMPNYMREWPRTRTWDNLEGEAFSSTFARLFQYLVQECGSVAVEILRGPLEEACSEVEERGKQCIAAEIMAGLLHSDEESVVEQWDDFFEPLLSKTLLSATMESAAEWAACIRFAVSGEGRDGRDVPELRHKILDCLGKSLAEEASTSLLTKRLTLLRAALVEILPNSGLERKGEREKEIALQMHLLDSITLHMSHRAPQVRQGVGKMLCIICANLQQSTAVRSSSSAAALPEVGNDGSSGVPDEVMTSGEKQEEEEEQEDESIERDGLKVLAEWRKTFVRRAEAAVMKILSEGRQHLGEASTTIEHYSPEGKEAVRWMETALHFTMAVIRSGNAPVLMRILVELLHPLLALQKTWNKELAKKAKTAMVLMRWQTFRSDYLGDAVAAVLKAATDSNWHTREAALKFMQPLTYRHAYIISSSDLEAIWQRVGQLLSDTQLEVREVATTTLAGMMKGEGGKHAEVFRETILESAKTQLAARSRRRKSQSSGSIVAIHGLVLGLSACVLSVPYDMPRWLPEMVVSLARFIREPWPVRATVTKSIGEFRRTHMDTWDLQKASFTEDQLEILSDLTSSASYFA